MLFRPVQPVLLLLASLQLASSVYMYGFAEPYDGQPLWTFSRLDSTTGNTTSIWTTTLSLEPYPAALDVSRKLVYAISQEQTVTGVNSSLVALSIEDGAQQFNVSLPFGQYASALLGHSAGTHSGTTLDLDASTGDVMVGGIIQSATHWRPSNDCSPACNASLCCVDPLAGGAACFDRITQCADIAENNGTDYFQQYKMLFKSRSLQKFEQPKVYWTGPTKTGSSALDEAARTLYVQLQVDPGSAPTTRTAPMLVFAYDIDTGKVVQTINVTAAVLRAQQADPTIFDFEDMNYDPATKRLVSVSLGVFSNQTSTQFVRCLVALDPESQNITRLSPHYYDLKHNDRVGVDSVFEPVTRVVYEFLSGPQTIELVGYSADTGKVAVDVSMTAEECSLMPTSIELGKLSASEP